MMAKSGLKGFEMANKINPDKTKEIFWYHYQLNKQIDNTGGLIDKIVEEHEKDFLAAFEQKMYVV